MNDEMKKKVRKVMREQKISFQAAFELLKRQGVISERQPIVEYRINRSAVQARG